MYKFLPLAFLLLSFSSYAEETETLTVDRVIANNLELAFPNDKNIKPKASDFELINYVVMSNDLGERWAVITLSNTSSGSRILEQEHLIALFADGKRKSPPAFKVSFKRQETQSITVSFGENKFPILSIITDVSR
jgi:hypothetical protein